MHWLRVRLLATGAPYAHRDTATTAARAPGCTVVAVAPPALLCTCSATKCVLVLAVQEEFFSGTLASPQALSPPRDPGGRPT